MSVSVDLALLGIGCAIGTGIFVLTGIAAATLSGPAVILSFVFAGIASGFAALSYAELAASVGGSGSAYGYSYVAFGEVVAWIMGWVLLLEYGVGAAAVANGWSGYFMGALRQLQHTFAGNVYQSAEFGRYHQPARIRYYLGADPAADQWRQGERQGE